MLRFFLNFTPKTSLVTIGQGVAENLHSVPIVEARDTLHQVGGGMVAKVRGDIAYPETPSTVKETLRVSIQRPTQTGHLPAVGRNG